MPIITDVPEESKRGVTLVSKHVLLAAAVILACTGSFGLGFLTGKESGGGEVYISGPTEQVVQQETGDIVQPERSLLAAPKASLQPVQKEPAPLPPVSSGGQYVASKSGTKYHLPWCPGAKQMKEENKIYFNSKEEAEAAGYTPAANCKGI